MLARLSISALLVAFTATPLGAVNLPFGKEPVSFLSGPYDNFSEKSILVREVELSGPSGATWMRVHFNQFQIGPRDYVRFEAGDGTSYRIEGRQVDRDAGLLRVGEYFSLFLNGSYVKVELWARSGSADEGVSIDFVHYGLAPGSGGISWNCALDQEEGTDTRAGRVIAMQVHPGSGDSSYVVCSAVALFPGDCILLDGSCLSCFNLGGDPIPCLNQPGVVDLTQAADLIVEFGVPPSLPFPNRGAIQHPSPRSQYRLRPSPEPCLDNEEVDSDYAVFLTSPNEASGYSHQGGFAERYLTMPTGGEAVTVEGFPQRPVTLNHTQTKDGSGGTLSSVNSTHFEANDNESVDAGSEGSAVRNDSGLRLYGILNEPICIDIVKPTLRASGTHFGHPDLDPGEEAGCVATLCAPAHGYVAYPTLVLRNRIRWSAALHLPDGTMHFNLGGAMDIQGGAPVFRWDRRVEIDTEIISLDLRGVGCLGPVVFRQSPTRPSLGLVRQQSESALFPVDSFFDIFVEVEVNGTTVHNRDPLHVAAMAQSIPPYGDLHNGPPAPVLLYDPMGAVVGSLSNLALMLEAPVDCASSGLQLVVDTLGPLQAQGSYEVGREATLWDLGSRRWKAPLEILAMDLRGTHPTLGPFIVRESRTLPSGGGALFDEAPTHPGTFPADSFFDVFFEIEFPAQGRTLINPIPVRMEGPIQGFPPLGAVLQNLNAVPLIDRDTGQPAGTLLQATQTPQNVLDWAPAPPPGKDAYCALGRVIVDLGSGVMAVDNLLGRIRVRRDLAQEQPSGVNFVPTEMLALWLHSDMTPVGPVDVRLRPEPSTLGGMLQLGTGPFFPANGFFDVFLEITTASLGTLRTLQPLRIRGVLGSLIDPPTVPYAGSNPAGIQLVDVMNQPRGRLFQMELFRGLPFDASCPATPACGPTAVDAGEGEDRPGQVALLSPRPNPTTGTLRVVFDLPAAAPVRLAAFDLAGRRVRRLIDGPLHGPERHHVLWDGTDDAGRPVGVGVYFIQLDVEGERISRKVMILR